MLQNVMRLVDRADKHVQSLKTKAFDEFTPEDIGHVCADLEGIIAFVRTCQEHGVFTQDERLVLLEAKVKRTDEWQRKFDEKLQMHSTNELRTRELIDENRRLRNELDEIAKPKTQALSIEQQYRALEYNGIDAIPDSAPLAD